MEEERRLVYGGGRGGEGILLYYKYAAVPDVPALVRLYETSCLSLGLLGRVRIGPDGVNVTVGGKLSSLEKHIAAVKSNSLFEGTDFKLASCDGPADERIARECGFASLSVRVVKELVTFRSHPLLKSPNISDAGKHLSAAEFHSILQCAGNDDSKGSVQHKQLLLLDARNLYETRIGMFQTPNVVTLNPGIRQYSDLPAWIDKHSEELHDHCVLMYCTGGIRCEMASAYIRSKGAGFGIVYQLFGGIQRYLEQFPDGGFFKGKNFVFDHRECEPKLKGHQIDVTWVSVCHQPVFQFSVISGFSQCGDEMLNLKTLGTLQLSIDRVSVGSQDATVIGSCLQCGTSFDNYSSRCRCTYCRILVLVCNSCQAKSPEFVCELCLKHHKEGEPIPLMDDDRLKLELSSDLLGELGPAILSVHAAPTQFLEFPAGIGIAPRERLKILCLHGFRQNASGFKGRTASLAKKIKNIAELIFVNAPHELPFIYQPRSSEPASGSIDPSTMEVTCSSQQPPPPCQNCKKKFAWLVSPTSNCPEGLDWKVTDQPFDPLQYQQQTDGFQESYTFLKKVFSQMGPFDGILGFSQGAAMASLVCDQQWKPGSVPDFRFAILCSGFPLLSDERNHDPISCPSLHIYGSSRGRDRQIACQASIELVSKFDKGCSMVIEHEMGHIIPTRSPHIDQIRVFLRSFLTV